MAASHRSDAALGVLAGYLRLLADPARLKILQALFAGERSVLEIVAETELGQPHVSRQLGLMAEAGLLVRRKEGTRVYYALRDARLKQLLDLAERSLREHLRVRLGNLEP